LSGVKAIDVNVIYVTSPSRVAECIRARQTRLEQFASFWHRAGGARGGREAPRL